MANDNVRNLTTRVPERGAGTGSHDVPDRYLNSRAVYPFREGPIFPKTAINELWCEDVFTPENTLRMHLRQNYGEQYRTAGPAQAENKVVIVGNPQGGLQSTMRGYEQVQQTVRMGAFQAGINASATARRRRGQ